MIQVHGEVALAAPDIENSCAAGATEAPEQLTGELPAVALCGIVFGRAGIVAPVAFPIVTGYGRYWICHFGDLQTANVFKPNLWLKQRMSEGRKPARTSSGQKSFTSK